MSQSQKALRTFGRLVGHCAFVFVMRNIHPKSGVCSGIMKTQGAEPQLTSDTVLDMQYEYELKFCCSNTLTNWEYLLPQSNV